jgi:hypothetical protein
MTLRPNLEEDLQALVVAFQCSIDKPKPMPTGVRESYQMLQWFQLWCMQVPPKPGQMAMAYGMFDNLCERSKAAKARAISEMN